MGDHRFDPLKPSIGRRVRMRQYTRGVKNIEPFIFHGAHIEALDCHDHKDVEIVLAPIGPFIPSHRGFQAFHRKVDLVDIMAFGKDLQRHGAS